MQRKYNFIKLEKVNLTNFSLYTKQGKTYQVNEVINKGVYCLAGANGLGKTTFLNAINYGLTGIILDPHRGILSPSEIESENKVFADQYFTGRIQKADLKDASIEITFSVNKKFFRIVRGFINRDELKAFEIFSINKDKIAVSLLDTKAKSPKQLNELYKEHLVSEVGFTDFDYFVFYQLYILTFDETRRMIFWDDRASYNALSIAFNSDPAEAVQVSELARRIDKYESNGRNARWQATQIKNKIDELTQKISKKKPKNIEVLEKEYNKLFDDLKEYENSLKNNKIEFDAMLRKQSYINSEIMQLRSEHTKLFSRYSKPRSKLLESANVILSLKKQECCICGAHGNYVVEAIEKTIHKDACPLCKTAIDITDSKEQGELLKVIEKNDIAISEKNEELQRLFQEIDFKRILVEKFEIEVETLTKKITEFDEDYPDLRFNKTGDEQADNLISQFQNQFDHYDTESKNAYKQRDKLKPQYEKLLKNVEIAYKEGEKVFVPIFKRLAKSFIGYELEINPKRDSKTIKLILELKDSARTQASQLSESQRFFLDIALRMSLLIYLSKPQSPGTMFIDTPEGSLDIAYESRVGTMFAEFATRYNQNMFMTANINASQLLISLAEKCGKNNMTFRRMLEWTDLSIVQKEGEKLFQKVYNDIEKALNKGK
ncbi:hypothetical protein [Pedobacter sp. R-06]|uniref:hypothetical protein n=1 Tax=Pedobacter sp. R-06 TaxID=3404051 RepID=UPI003CF4961C